MVKFVEENGGWAKRCGIESINRTMNAAHQVGKQKYWLRGTVIQCHVPQAQGLNSWLSTSSQVNPETRGLNTLMKC